MMSAVQLVDADRSAFKWRTGSRAPSGVTVEGVVGEREKIVERYGRATAKESADEVLARPEEFPNLRAFGPPDAETAFRRAMENGIRHAYAAVVEVISDPSSKRDRPVAVRVFHAVPTGDDEELSYEPLEVIRQHPNQRAYLIQQLRQDAETFSEKMQTVLAEVATIVE